MLVTIHSNLSQRSVNLGSIWQDPLRFWLQLLRRAFAKRFIEETIFSEKRGAGAISASKMAPAFSGGALPNTPLLNVCLGELTHSI
jgi:hypothetical protein